MTLAPAEIVEEIDLGAEVPCAGVVEAGCSFRNAADYLVKSCGGVPYPFCRQCHELDTPQLCDTTWEPERPRDHFRIIEELR
jgi:hypothetical protein